MRVYATGRELFLEFDECTPNYQVYVHSLITVYTNPLARLMSKMISDILRQTKTDMNVDTMYMILQHLTGNYKNKEPCKLIQMHDRVPIAIDGSKLVSLELDDDINNILGKGKTF